MTEIIDIAFGDRQLTVAYQWHARFPETRIDPEDPGGPEIEEIWDEAGQPIFLSHEECDRLVDEIERIVTTQGNDYE